MDLNRCWGIVAQCFKGCVNPWFQAKAVVKEKICRLETNEVFCSWLIVVNRNVVLAHVFQLDIIACNGLDDLSDVVRGYHDGTVRFSIIGFLFCISS